MIRRGVALLVVVASLMVGGCGGGDPLGRLLDHQEAIVATIEDRADDPEAAAKAAEDYLAEHRGEIEALRREAAESGDDSRGVATQAMEHAEQLVDVGRRTVALRKNAALMEESAIREALDLVTNH